jgi:uncharacterized protein DUF4199
MKKTVLIFGFASGALSAAMMLATVPFILSGRFNGSLVFGYTLILLASLLVFFGIRSYRQKVGGGRLTFLRGLGVGVAIAAISAACYAATWSILWLATPDLHDKMAACMVNQKRASGASDAEILKAAEQAAQYVELAKNPALNFLMSLAEPFPVGLAVSLISAAILRRKDVDPS